MRNQPVTIVPDMKLHRARLHRKFESVFSRQIQRDLMTSARRGRRDRAAPGEVDWPVNMTARNSHDLSMPPHNFFHHAAAVQSRPIHPLHAGAKRWVMHENQRRKFGPRAERFVEPSKPFLAEHPMMVS